MASAATWSSRPMTPSAAHWARASVAMSWPSSRSQNCSTPCTARPMLVPYRPRCHGRLLDVDRLLVEPDVVAAADVAATCGLSSAARRVAAMPDRREAVGEDAPTFGRPRARIGPVEFERNRVGATAPARGSNVGDARSRRRAGGARCTRGVRPTSASPGRHRRRCSWPAAGGATTRRGDRRRGCTPRRADADARRRSSVRRSAGGRRTRRRRPCRRASTSRRSTRRRRSGSGFGLVVSPATIVIGNSRPLAACTVITRTASWSCSGRIVSATRLSDACSAAQCR